VSHYVKNVFPPGRNFSDTFVNLSAIDRVSSLSMSKKNANGYRCARASFPSLTSNGELVIYAWPLAEPQWVLLRYVFSVLRRWVRLTIEMQTHTGQPTLVMLFQREERAVEACYAKRCLKTPFPCQICTNHRQVFDMSN
jgi:hypothetical protein